MFQSFELTADKGATPDRVAALRAAMAEAGVTGFLVPRADAHQGENVAPRDERLAWLTGFTGSAGIAVVMAERAALFVDGRYTLQASDQVVTDIFEIVPMHETPVHKWLETALPQNGKLAYDPWLHGKTQIDQIRKVAKTSGTALISLNENLIDKVWTDQPPAPAGAVRIHGFDVAGEDNAAKRSRIGAVVADKGASQAVLTLPDSIAWLLNIRGSDIARSPVAHGFAIAKADGHVDLFMDPDKLDGTVREHLGNTVSIHGPDALAAALGALEGPVLLDQTSCPLWVAEQMAETGQELIWGEDPCIQPKAAKNASEIAGMHAAHQRDGTAMIRFLCWLDGAIAAGETLTEIDIVTRLEGFRAAAGDLSDISFDTIAGSGPNGAIVHYRVNRDSNRALVPGELLLVDSGGQYPDGTTDITRTMPTGPVTDAQRKHFTLVLKGMIGLSRIRWPKGLNGRDLDPLARAALWRAGLDYDHGTGHGVGASLNVHEGPQNISRRGTSELKPGMIVSNEPGFYLEGAYGIRIENLVIVSEPDVPRGGMRPMLGFETLTWCPIDRRLIDPVLLDAEERAWLDAYHAEVLARIGPLLDDATAAWLAAACAPIDAEPITKASRFTIRAAQGTVVVRAGGSVFAESKRALVLKEGDYPPVFYLPRTDAGLEFMEPSDTSTTCPHKGEASYFNFTGKSQPIPDAAWSYQDPVDGASAIRGYVAFYGDKVTVEEI